jgi:hypothetical protein
MAAFIFPENPNNNQVEKNTDTNVSYIYKNPPGKWEVLAPDNDNNYVNVTGDTMTGALAIEPSAPIPASTQTSSLEVVASPFSEAAEDQNYISRVLDIKNNEDKSIFSIRNSDAANLPIVQGKKSAITSYASEFNISPSLAQLVDDFSSGGQTAGFKIQGRVSGGSSAFDDVLTSTYFGGSTPAATQISYFGDITDGNNIVNKTYVDTTISSSGLIHGGTIAAGDEGSVSNTGNLAIQKSTGGAGGNLYIRSAPNTDVIALNQTGEIKLYGAQQITATGTSNNSVKLYAGTTSSASFGTDYISLKQQVTANQGITVLANGISVNAGTSTFKGTADFQSSLLFSQSGSQVAEIQNNLLFYGLKADGTRPSWEAIKLGSDPVNENFSALTIGKRLYWQGGYAYLSGSVRNYLNTSTWDYRDTEADNNIITELNTTGYTINTPTNITAPFDNYQPGLTLSTKNNITTLWNATQPGHLQFQTTSGSNGGSCGIFVNGDGTSPAFTMAVGAPGYSLDRVFSFSYNSTYGKRVYMYPDWGQSYSNAKDLPDATPVTLGYLRNQGLITQAFTSVVPSSDPNDLDDAITTQTSVSVGAQMQLDGRLTSGRGFSLSGCTTDQPTNTSAICVQLYHPITAAAQLLYNGDTTSDNTCVQTKASTLSLIQGHNNTFTSTNNFHGAVNIGTSSTGRLVDVFNVLRVRANSNNDLSGFNNGSIYVNDKTGATVAGMYDSGLYTAKKLIFQSNTGTQDIMLQGADNKGLNIKYDVGTQKGLVLAKFDVNGSLLKSSLDLNLNKLLNIQTPTDGFDGANKTYVDSSISTALTGDQSFPNMTLTGTTALTINNATNNAGIHFTSSQSVQGIKAYGASDKALKFFVGPTANDATQQLAIQKDELLLGSGSNAFTVKVQNSTQFPKFEFGADQVLTLQFGTESPIYISNYAGGQGGRMTGMQSIEFKNQIDGNGGYEPSGTTRISYLSNPSLGHDAANKQYVDSTTASLKSTLHAAVNGAADFAALKAALLAALA